MCHGERREAVREFQQVEVSSDTHTTALENCRASNNQSLQQKIEKNCGILFVNFKSQPKCMMRFTDDGRSNDFDISHDRQRMWWAESASCIQQTMTDHDLALY